MGCLHGVREKQPAVTTDGGSTALLSLLRESQLRPGRRKAACSCRGRRIPLANRPIRVRTATGSAMSCYGFRAWSPSVIPCGRGPGAST
jgi:hypothetical protein